MNKTGGYKSEPSYSDKSYTSFKSGSMSNEVPQGDHAAPSSQVKASFNPLTTHSSNQSQRTLGNSVVPDLMSVYESLTRNSTPHPGPSGPEATPHSHAQVSHQHQYMNQFQQPATPAPQGHSQTYGLPAQHYYTVQTAQDGTTSSNPLVCAEEGTTYSGRSLRKRSLDMEDDRSSNEGNNSRSRKKGNSDGRWSKRFAWPDELHQDFVSAVFDVGLKHASPSAILSQMPKYDEITSERIKSHLQKYRVHRSKSKKEFMGAYAASLNMFRIKGDAAVKSVAGGEVAAHLTYTTTKEEESENGTSAAETPGSATGSTDKANQGGTLVLPRLTEDEKQSPIGASMGYLMGLYFSLHQQLMTQRAARTGPGSVEDSLQEGLQLGSYMPVSSGAAHDHVSSAQPGSSLPTPVSSTRTHLEESHLMKRDMQSSREIQNKMRALKQHELNKVKGSVSIGHTEGQWSSQLDGDEVSRGDMEQGKTGGMEDSDEKYQGAGETAEGGVAVPQAKDRSRSLSIGHPDDFWGNDEQLFEFLMNP